MSTVIVLTPVIISSWPAITAAVAGAAAALGLSVSEAVVETKEALQEAQNAETTSVEIDLADSEVLQENLGSNKQITLTRDDVTLTVKRDERGRCMVQACGKGRTKAELEQIAQEFTERMTQCFIYNRVVSEVKQKGFQVVKEQVGDDESVRIQVRRWVE